MEPRYDAQDIERCHICKIDIDPLVHSYCDFCHVNLCRPCIGEHISDEHDRHKIVSFRQRKSTLIYPKCETHHNEECKYQCKDCNIFVCSHCTASTEHTGHNLLKLEELFRKLKKHVQNDMEELDNQIQKYEELANDLKNQIVSLEGEYEKLTREMSKQKDELHRKIDNLFDQMDKEIGEFKVKHHSILKEQSDEIKQLQSCMQETLLTLNDLEDSNEVSPTIHYISKNREFSKLPPKVLVTMPKFIPTQIDTEESCIIFGKLIPFSTKMEERVFRAKKPHTFEKKEDEKVFPEEEDTSPETIDVLYIQTYGSDLNLVETVDPKIEEHVPMDQNQSPEEKEDEKVFPEEEDASPEIIDILFIEGPGESPVQELLSNCKRYKTELKIEEEVLESANKDYTLIKKKARESGCKIPKNSPPSELNSVNDEEKREAPSLYKVISIIARKCPHYRRWQDAVSEFIVLTTCARLEPRHSKTKRSTSVSSFQRKKPKKEYYDNIHKLLDQEWEEDIIPRTGIEYDYRHLLTSLSVLRSEFPDANILDEVDIKVRGPDDVSNEGRHRALYHFLTKIDMTKYGVDPAETWNYYGRLMLAERQLDLARRARVILAKDRYIFCHDTS